MTGTIISPKKLSVTAFEAGKAYLLPDQKTVALCTATTGAGASNFAGVSLTGETAGIYRYFGTLNVREFNGKIEIEF